MCVCVCVCVCTYPQAGCADPESSNVMWHLCVPTCTLPAKMYASEYVYVCVCLVAACVGGPRLRICYTYVQHLRNAQYNACATVRVYVSVVGTFSYAIGATRQRDGLTRRIKMRTCLQIYGPTSLSGFGSQSSHISRERAALAFIKLKLVLTQRTLNPFRDRNVKEEEILQNYKDDLWGALSLKVSHH